MKSRRAIAAYTLIELLVALALVLVLSMLVFSGMNKIRDNAKSSKCINNLRMFGMAFANYTVENGDTFPVKVWMDPLLKYVDKKVFVCPAGRHTSSVTNAVKDGSLFTSDTRWKDNKSFLSYGYNMRYLAADWNGVVISPKRKAIQYPGEMVMLADTARVSGTIPQYGFYQLEIPTQQYAMPAPWHNGMANILYVDGHVAPCQTSFEAEYKYLTLRNFKGKD